MGRLLLIGCVLLILVLPTGIANAEGDEFPLIWVSATDLLYAGGEESNGYTDVFHLSYKYSSDWVLIAAKTAVFDVGTITFSDGTQYAFSQEGKKLNEVQFSGMLEIIDHESMERASIGDDGTLLTPFSGPKIGYAVIQSKGGALTQVSLAGDAEEYQDNLHLYEGFLYQFNEDLSLAAQIAFSEISFSTQGLLRSTVEAPPPLEYPPSSPVSEPATPAIVPYTENPLPGESGSVTSSGTIEASTITIPKDYDVPPITRIGVVMVGEHTGNPDFIVPATEALVEELSEIEGLEVTNMGYDEKIWGGGILFERAVELGAEYSVDAFIISEITDFDFPDFGRRGPSITEVSISYEMEFAVVDCTGGRIFWRTDIDNKTFIAVHELDRNEERLKFALLEETIAEGIKRFKKNDVTAGGPIGKEW